jgi:riboflavin kinase/FMN adenylyltransferase
VHAGELSAAEELLGRRFRLSGFVRDGLARGRDMGYPTANLGPPNGLCIPADGIYAAYARTAEQPDVARETLVYIGASPTFDPRERLIEAHILDFSGDLYATELDLELVEFLRGDQTFDSVDELVAQIQRDEAAARQLFSVTHPEVEAEAAE